MLLKKIQKALEFSFLNKSEREEKRKELLLLLEEIDKRMKDSISVDEADYLDGAFFEIKYALSYIN